MDELLKVLASNGVSGAVLAFILWKLIPSMEKAVSLINSRITSLEHGVERMTKGEMLRLAASPHVSDSVKMLAADIIKEVDKAEANRVEEARAKD